MRQRIYIDRTQYDLGDRGDVPGSYLYEIAETPDTHELWRVADWGYREYLKGPMAYDEKVPNDATTVFLGSGYGAPVRFYSAPRFINGASDDQEQSSLPTERRVR